MTHKPYVNFVLRQFDGNAFDWDSVALKVMAASSSYAPNRETHIFKSSVTNELTDATDWPAGGIALNARTVTYDSTTRQVRLLGGTQISVPNVTIAGIRYFVVYNSTPATDAARQLVSLIDLEADENVDGTLSITWDATGVGRFVLPA